MQPFLELEARRMKAISALKEGHSRSEVAAMMGTTHTSVSKWAARYQRGGIADLLARPQGRPSTSWLFAADDTEARRILLTRLPDEVGLSGSLWIWRLVQALVYREFGVEFSRWTISRKLREWGFQPPHSDYLALEPVPHPPIRNRGVRIRISESRLGPQGENSKTDSLPLSIMWAIGGRGEAAFMVYEDQPTAEVLVSFLERLLVHEVPRSLVITGDENWFRAASVCDWLTRNEERVSVSLFLRQEDV